MASPLPNTVVVTGGSGFLGHMVIQQLLERGSTVRATVRPSKLELVRKTYPNAGDKLQLVEMADLVEDAHKWPIILKGADAFIHIAAPVYHPGVSSEYLYRSSVEGTEKLLAALEGTSIKNFVLTSSIGAFFTPDFSNIFEDHTWDHNTWSEIQDIDPKTNGPAAVYLVSKSICDRLVWKAAEKYPDIDFTSIFPSTIYGWFTEHYPVAKESAELNANKFIWEMFQKGVEFPAWPSKHCCHNRDVAKAHVLALTAPPLPKGEKKRLIVSSNSFSWVEAIQFLQTPGAVTKLKERGHDISERLPDVTKAGLHSQFKLDTSLTEQVLGLRQEDYVSWQDTLLEVVLGLLDWERAYPEAASK